MFLLDRQTMLFIGHNQMARADFARGKLKNVWRGARPMGEELPALVDAALKLSNRRCGRVLVLATDVWTQIVTLQPGAIAGLTGDELGRALAFEAEALSGLSAFDSEASYVALGAEAGQRLFRIVQLPRWQRDEIAATVAAAGAALQGIAHPAALDVSLTDDSQAVWRRVELWSQSAAALEGDGSRVTRPLLLHADPRSARVVDEITAWQQRGTGDVALEVVAEDRSLLAFGPRTEQSLALDDDTGMRQFLTAWIRRLARKEAVLPVIRAVVRPMTAAQRALWAAGLAAVVLGAVALDYSAAHGELDALRAEATEIKQRASRLETMKKEIASVTKARDKQRLDRDLIRTDVEHTELALDHQRQRWARLLTLLAGRCPDHLAVQRIDQQNGRLLLSGVCLGPDPANQLATALGGELRSLGWQVLPAKKDVGVALDTGDPWKFVLELRDLPLPPAATVPAIPPVARPEQRVVRSAASDAGGRTP